MSASSPKPKPKRSRTRDFPARNNRFREGGEQKYNDYFSKRAILPERDVDLSRLPPTFLPQLIETRKWSKALTGHVAPSIEIVREFYSNLYYADSVKRTCKVMLRGVTFDFSADGISNLYELPRVTNPTFPYKYGEEPDKDTIALTLTGNQFRWYTKNLPLNHLIPEFYFLSVVIAADVYPKFDVLDLSPAKGLFLYGLKDGREFDLANYIWDWIYDAARSPSTITDLPFPSLITRMAEAKRIAILPEERSPKGSNISVHTWNLTLSYSPVPSIVPHEEQQPQEKNLGAHPCDVEEERPADLANVHQEGRQPQEEYSHAAHRKGEEERLKRTFVPAPGHSDLIAHLGTLGAQMSCLGTQIAGVHQYVLRMDSQVRQRLDSIDARFATFAAHVDGELSYWKHRFIGGEKPAPPVPDSSTLDLTVRLESLSSQMTSRGTQLACVDQYVRQMDSRLTQRLDSLEARLSTFTARSDGEVL